MSDIQKEYAPKGFTVVGGTIDQTGMLALQDFVQRFNPGFPIGAMDPNAINAFGQFGAQRTFVPMVFLIDKNGVIQGQFMGSDTFFEGDKIGNIRASLNYLMGISKKPPPSAAPKK